MRATTKATLLWLGLLAGGGATIRAQIALDSFYPKPNSTVWDVAAQPDGKVIIGGYFTLVAPNGGASVTRNFIARLNPDGTLDTNWNPNANGAVLAIAVQADGKVLAGGFFSSIGGQTRNRIARLDPTTGLADSFDPNAGPNASIAVRTIVVQPDNKVLIGGDFTRVTPNGGTQVTRNHIARLNPDGSLDAAFDPNANLTVERIAVQTDGQILVGGSFNGPNCIGGQMRNFMARVNGVTGVADSFNPNPLGVVYAIAIQPDGKIVVGGGFNGANSIGGASRNRIARLDASGFADSFNPNANGPVRAVAIQAEGDVLAGGAFVGTNSIGGATRNRLARLDPATGAAGSFDPNADAQVNAITVQADGRVLVGGFFSAFAPNGGATVTRPQVARFATTGGILSITRAANDHIVLQCLGVPNQVNDLRVSPDLSPGSFAPINPPPPAADSTGAFLYDDDVDALALTKRFYRLAFP